MDGYTESIVIVLGSPVRGNPAQFAIERGLESIGLDWRVLSLEVDLADLATAIDGFRVSGIRAIWFDDGMAKHAPKVLSDDSSGGPSTAIDGFVRHDNVWEKFEVRAAVRQREADDAVRLKEAASAKDTESTKASPGSSTASPGSSTASPGSSTASPGSSTASPGSSTASPGSSTSKEASASKSAVASKHGSRIKQVSLTQAAIPQDSLSQPNQDSTDFEPAWISDAIRRQTRQLQLCIEVWTGKRVPVSVLAEAIEEYESV
jgi:hypothetical protein